ncbi:ABC transporter ATP-binding protein [Phaeobacter gallaeciensis]|uniref:ABC transporter ATP-binding protein n=1 Tax=Rhodobacterales TaxID=204455 RepID=UPI00237FCB6B|nr:ABC transporter ATP-binding protein [Phaeobacter gallaeciensis]MDE4193471.1 ABC transporter ATP-binding protein [Phaeobacter gallaeciensis]MDE4201799.1 ABC transporter ATP-binding protein [Phaeobacter gallaeciensis]MDE4205918.1 ABC transporter ATP-binding protein [Phaeobacter gallaeciensis]MDE4210093.1 ABC transporter ATP-binding protein [Phaeobacter gallaeciensis]MDE4218461.1 ABC transporter ATP-binding protein [Phaeobacter gallaeciensis]
MSTALEIDAFTISGLLGWTHHIADLIGFRIIENPPQWLHVVLQLVLVVAPLATLLCFLIFLVQITRSVVQNRLFSVEDRMEFALVRRLIGLRWHEQVTVIFLGLLAQPVLYATLELPKRIVNGAIESNHFPVDVFHFQYTQLEFLGLLSILYLIALIVSGAIKYCINIKKGEIGERTLLRLRLVLYRAWRRAPEGQRRTEVIPLSTSEIEPIGGFAGDVLATPVFQGGTLVTVLLFMFIQDPILGAAAMTLVPVQLFIIPILQRWVNKRMRARIRAVRAFGDVLGEQTGDVSGRYITRKTLSAAHKLRNTRLELQRAKYLQKAISNFLMSLTPFLLYSIGGWLVIEGRLSLGALVAVIAAFKDFSSPFRELILYYQNSSDVRLRSREYENFLMKCGRAIHGLSVKQWSSRPQFSEIEGTS